MIRIFWIDESPLMRIGIQTALSNEKDIDIDIEVETTDVSKVQELCEEISPDLLVIDFNILGSLERLSTLSQELLDTKILILVSDNDFNVKKITEFNVLGCILKNESPENVIHAIRTTARGNIWLSQVFLSKLFQEEVDNHQAIIFNLTGREQQLLHLIAQGWSNDQIANNLCLARQTVRNYISRLYDKLGVDSRVQAVVWARENDFISEFSLKSETE